MIVFAKMYAQTLSVVRPKLYTRSHLWIRKIPMTECEKTAVETEVIDEKPKPGLTELAVYRAVQKRILLLTDTMSLYKNLPESIQAVCDYALHEFVGYHDLMQVTMGESEKQAGFTNYMMMSIENALTILDAYSRKQKIG